MELNFSSDLKMMLKHCKSNNYVDNFDYNRFGSVHISFYQLIKSRLKDQLQKFGIYGYVSKQLALHAEELQWLYLRLADVESRKLLVTLMAYRILGYRRVKLPLNTPTYWNNLKELEKLATLDDCIELDFNNWKVCRNDLKNVGYPVQVYARTLGVLTQFVLEQYRCTTTDSPIEVSAGNTVIDCGGCYGDTALYFACKAGNNGKVYSFEFMPNNLHIFNRNLAINPEMMARIEIVPHPVWSTSGEKLYVEGHGPATNVTTSPKTADAKEVSTLCIDDLAQEHKIQKVNFIKMDIEGSELEALCGAEQTIRRDKPKLAISVYHRLHDFWMIPRWIEGLNLGYNFYLRHFTIHTEETVLFAEAPN